LTGTSIFIRLQYSTVLFALRFLAETG